ncbi:MAG TPA: hypothetical protein VMV51_06815 [Gemmatimonadaceae bacterium]|nr:hypothetical protein [Gemmatimonadaceae bacterium]
MCAALGVVAMMTAPARVCAQSRWSFEGDLGFATVTGGEFRLRDANMLSAQLDVAAARWSRADLFVGVSNMRLSRWGDVTTVCEIGSHGQCVPPAPDVGAWSAVVGARVAPLDYLAFDVGTSLGWADRGPGRRVPVLGGRASAALRAVGPVWLTAGLQVMAWHVNGDALRAAPWFVGVRLH